MVKAMKSYSEQTGVLTLEERNLLTVAYKNTVGSRRAAWRILSSLEAQQNSNNTIIKNYRLKIEEELRSACEDLLNLLETNLMPQAQDSEAKVFYYKLRGDYYRYFAEFTQGAERQSMAESALLAYKNASTIAQKDIPATHPVRLGLALNFSVFYYEILNSPDQAVHVARAAFEEADAEIDSLPQEAYHDSVLIMQLLRDNLTLWSSENTDD